VFSLEEARLEFGEPVSGLGLLDEGGDGEESFSLGWQRVDPGLGLVGVVVGRRQRIEGVPVLFGCGSPW
jgi:hypothetical protein